MAVRRLWQQSRKEVIRVVIMEAKERAGFKKTRGRKNWQDLVIIWIYGVKKREGIKMTPPFVTSVTISANIEKGVGVRRRIETVFYFVHTAF